MKRKKLAYTAILLFVAFGLGIYFWQSRAMQQIPDDAVPHADKLYKIYYVDIPWDQAKRLCEQRGGQLAIVEDQATLDFLQGLKGGKRVWLGATDEHREGDWKWVDGTPVAFDGWAPRQPFNLQGKEHYMELGPAGRFNDVGLAGPTKKYPIQGYVCEWPKPKEDSID